MMPQNRVRVQLADRGYDIVVGHRTLAGLGAALQSFAFSPKAALISNPTVFRLYGQAVEQSLTQAGFEVIRAEMQDGEPFKNLATVSALWDRLLAERLDRKSPVIALGGGVVGDVAGFVAATYMRGIPYVQIPTTLLAQVDSSVGGKTGIDHPEGKNLIGAFHQPSLVWIDTATLKTLGARELRCGLAEVVKYGVIADAGFFAFLEKNLEALLRQEPEPLGRVIRRCCEIKADVVAKDERESGLRAILNFGHTIGHAVEAQAGYQQLKHGEAVAIGMAAETRLAIALGLTERSTLTRIESLLTKIGLPSRIPRQDPEALLHLMSVDKKAEVGAIRVVLPSRIGQALLPRPLASETLRPVLAEAMQ